MAADSNIDRLTVRNLVNSALYKIPIYQRNYDWGEREALQLVEDIADYAATKSDRKYYIGSLVVFVRNRDGQEYFETIDGQQRLTTLTILLCLMKCRIPSSGMLDWYERPNLTYDHRTEADEALRMLFEQRLSDSPAAEGIVDVYRVFDKHIDGILRSKGIDEMAFLSYLLDKVVIMRIPVPRHTDLNHYFEIMNSRGEQLEKHEVLKAHLISYLDSDDADEAVLFDLIWQACADLASYVQMKFDVRLRDEFFGTTWNALQYDDFDRLLECYKDICQDDVGGPEIGFSLAELFDQALNSNVKYNLPDTGNTDNDSPDRFGSVVNFPNLLLHALKVMYHRDDAYDPAVDAQIRLDDKRLIDIFAGVLGSATDRRALVKRFIMALLKTRLLFDRYVIKRENRNGKESWSLKMLKRYINGKSGYVDAFNDRDNDDDDEQSKDIRMLQSMFHVSAPTQIYKYWLNAALHYLYDNRCEPAAYRDYLYRLACAYMLDRYLTDSPVEFEDIIYKNNAVPRNCEIDWTLIDRGCNVENFIFNFYDYVTWRADTAKYQKFEFTYRTSVEHFYPRNPMPQYPRLTKADGLDDFGNLCLISRGMNSKFSNNMPKAKCANFGPEATNAEISLKLIEMMDVCSRKGWSSSQISDFEDAARARLAGALL